MYIKFTLTCSTTFSVSQVLPNVCHFLSPECSPDLAVRAVSIVANLLENSKRNKETNVPFEHEVRTFPVLL